MTAEKLRENIFFYGIFLLLGILTVILLWPFVYALLFALALLVLLKPLYDWLMPKRLVNGSSNRATALTIVIFILLLAIPLIWFGARLISQVGGFLEDISTFTLSATTESEDIITRLQSALETLASSDFTLQEIIGSIQNLGESISSWVTDAILTIVQLLPSFFVNAIIILVVLMVALPRFEQPDKSQIAQVIPLPAEITQLYLDKISLMIMAMFKGTFVIAIVQGAAMGVVFWLAGVPYVAVLTVICIFLALLPMIGISLVAWPVGILLILQGDVWQGVFVILMFLIIVAQIDAILRPQLVPKGAYLNPALVLLSVFGGILLMGVIGVIYGPVIMVLLVTTIEIYTHYYANPDAIREDGKIDLHTLGLIPDEDVPDEENVLRKAGHSVRRGASRVLNWAMTEENGEGETPPVDSGPQTADGEPQTADTKPQTADSKPPEEE
jgi:predicted PurR-regulated permease PerM